MSYDFGRSLSNVVVRTDPGNCTENTWGGRNCPAVITSGDLKLMLGYVGDPRRLPMNESTGGESVVFGSTGGVCGLAGFEERCEAGHLLDPDGQPDIRSFIQYEMDAHAHQSLVNFCRVYIDDPIFSK